MKVKVLHSVNTTALGQITAGDEIDIDEYTAKQFAKIKLVEIVETKMKDETVENKMVKTKVSNKRVKK